MNRRKTFWRGQPGQNHRRKVSAVLYIALPILAWRLLDLLEEIINGPIKMSLDRYMVTGTPATVLQVLIIAVLFFVTFGAASAMNSPAKETPLP
jgi:hypothetical protein